MRILAADSSHYCASQIRFIKALQRFWWLQLLLGSLLLWHTYRLAPAFPAFALATAAVGVLSYGLLIRIDLQVETASLSFALAIFVAMWPARMVSDAHLLGQQWQLLLTLRYLTGIFLVWALAVPFTRSRLQWLLQQKQAFLQSAIPLTLPADVTSLRPVLNFTRLRQHRDRTEKQP